MKKKVAAKVRAKNIPTVIDRVSHYGHDEDGVKIPSMFWKHKAYSRRVKSKDVSDLQNRVSSFYQTMRDSDVHHIPTSSKHGPNMLYVTAPTKKLHRGDSLKKDIRFQESSPKSRRSRIFSGYVSERSRDDGASIYDSKIFSPKNEGRYIAELAWHTERSQSLMQSKE